MSNDIENSLVIVKSLDINQALDYKSLAIKKLKVEIQVIEAKNVELMPNLMEESFQDFLWILNLFVNFGGYTIKLYRT